MSSFFEVAERLKKDKNADSRLIKILYLKAEIQAHAQHSLNMSRLKAIDLANSSKLFEGGTERDRQVVNPRLQWIHRLQKEINNRQA